LVLSGLAVAPFSRAEDVEKKWRLALAAGGWNANDSIESDAANVLQLVDEDFITTALYFDPRDDSAVFGELDINSGPVATFSAQYAVTKMFMFEAAVGYGKYDVGDVEVSAQFTGTVIPSTENFQFATFRLPVGELERVPVQLSAIARFRPRASFNPYIGAGLGYTFIGFKVDPDFNEFSRNLDASSGEQTRVTNSFGTNAQLISQGTPSPLEGAVVDADDTFEWHITGGAELSFKRKWALFLDLRLSFASRDLFIGFNGSDYLGIPVPQLQDFDDSEFATGIYGPVVVINGGILDGGSLQPRPTAPANTDCDADPGDCQFIVGEFDGELDRGNYYAQGGAVSYDGLSMQIGVRYTF
jgi:hypothetical protein